MKKTLYSLLFILSVKFLFAANGDTTKVLTFNKFHMSRYGNFDTTVKFPNGQKKYQKILMKYTLGCLSNGQCEWDYTNTLFVRENTGRKDSSLKQANNYRVVGQVTTPDIFYYLNDTSYQYFFNSTTKKADSSISNPITILLSKDSLRPTVVTDTIKGWATYYRVNYDTTGKALDSVLVRNNSLFISKVVYNYFQFFDVINDFELGRMITPYAKFFPKTFSYTYVFDVTDYVNQLRDSATIRMLYSGYSFGFTCTVSFEFIEGTPPRDVYQVVPLYRGYFPYGNASNSIENYLTEKFFMKDQNSVSPLKLRLTVTGHGAENNEGCSEFCAKKFFVFLNKNIIGKETVWKDNCGENAIVNQGGTWIYDRANWCPGEQIEPYTYDVQVGPGGNLLNIDFESFTSSGSAGYDVSADLIYYKDYNYKNNASIEEIVRPSKDFRYQRQNPICENAAFILKNNGKDTLKELTISYQCGNKRPVIFKWVGSLPYGKTRLMNLQYTEWDVNNKTFKIWIEKPNGVEDENPTDNRMEVANFATPKVFPSKIVIETTTNKFPEENSWKITDAFGRLVASKAYTKATFRHYDTVSIGYGCFTFELLDSGKDGLDFWATRDKTGTGSCRITQIEPTYKVLENINADFGSFHKVNFTGLVGISVEEEELNEKESVTLYPNPAKDKLSIQLNLGKNTAPKTYQVFDMQGKIVFSTTTKDCLLDLDVSLFSKGVYLLVVNMNNQSINQKFIVE